MQIDISLALLDDLQRTCNQTKASIAKAMAYLETILKPEQLQEIKGSLTTKFHQLASVYTEKKQGQYKKPRPTGSKGFKGARRQAPQRGQKFDPKIIKLTLYY